MHPASPLLAILQGYKSPLFPRVHLPPPLLTALRSPILRLLTSLVRSLKARRGDRTIGPDPITAGVEIHDFESASGIQIEFYDFAGQVCRTYAPRSSVCTSFYA